MIFADIKQSGCDSKLTAILESMDSAKEFQIVNNVKLSMLGFKSPPKYKNELAYHWILIHEGNLVGMIETIAGNAVQTWSGGFNRTERDVELAKEKIEIKKIWAHNHNLPCLFLDFNDIVNTRFCREVLERFFIKILPKHGQEAILEKIFELEQLAKDLMESQ